MDGIGANYVTEKGRIDGIKGYTFYIRLCLLMGLVGELEKAGSVSLERGDVQLKRDGRQTEQELRGYVPLPWKAQVEEFSRSVPHLVEEFPWLKGKVLVGRITRMKEEEAAGTNSGGADGKTTDRALDLFLELFGQYTKEVFKSKKRDDKRGAAVLGQLYGAAHETAEEDKIVKQTKMQMQAWIERVGRIKGAAEGAGARSKL